ncbi:glycosyltransferase family 2 protein [Paenibacillus sp. GSMTC-2017]|uniref:glycosyltransferase family 2 protein n=1 Tax=Paenibacillus sp. GSMTC-2017 TaxID=2794350 RepID=UPI0018D79E91|nr:glycosyltransferase family 2 protein [Paenibacillus sp. GSMTC-2017]MBH5319721.1 glycosyltransferase family 2 protein [Paenibacillus sp. GSMTC-2017]
MNQQQPLVSVILATYNRASIISSSIESVIKQTYTNWELIIVDDRSTDNTKELIEQYIRKDARIRYAVNDRTKGVPGPKNCGMLQAKGEYIAFLDSDDQWFDNHLTDSIRVIQDNKVDICFAFWKEQVNGKVKDVFDDSSYQKRLESVRNNFEVQDDVIVFPAQSGLLEKYITDTLSIFNIITMVFKRSLLDTFELFGEGFEAGEDAAFIINFFDHCRIALHCKPHFVYNLSQDSVYFFCDRKTLDPDTLFENKDVLNKLELIGLRTVTFKMHLRRKIEGFEPSQRKKLLLLSDYALARQFYTLSYINRTEQKKALRYCWMSMKHNVNLFNILLMFYIVITKKKRNNFLKRPVDLW